MPSSGRSTLYRTLISLQHQENPEWRALVLLDGMLAGIDQRTAALASREEARIRVWRLAQRIGSRLRIARAEVAHGSAGKVRNFAFAHVRTPWLGFVDDDDTVGPRYVADVAADSDSFDVVSFRMRWTPWDTDLRPNCFGYQCTPRSNTTTSEVLPEWNASFLLKGHCGISFAMRTHLTRTGLRFGENMFEDYYIRVDMYRRRLRVLQSAGVRYYIKGEPRLEAHVGQRIVNPLVCTQCKIGIPEADRSLEFQLARVMAAEDPRHSYEHYRRKLLQPLCGWRAYAGSSPCQTLV